MKRSWHPSPLNGADPKVVSELLGRSSIQVTMNVYAQVWPPHKAAALTLLPYGAVDSGHAEGTELVDNLQCEAV